MIEIAITIMPVPFEIEKVYPPRGQIELIRREFRGVSGWIAFEFAIPRGGRRGAITLSTRHTRSQLQEPGSSKAAASRSARGSERIGFVTSSGASRLKPEELNVHEKKSHAVACRNDANGSIRTYTHPRSLAHPYASTAHSPAGRSLGDYVREALSIRK